MIYHMTQADEELAMKIAHQRNDGKVNRNIRSNKFYNGRSEIDTHVSGARAEIAICRTVPGAQMDTQERLDGDKNTHDIIMPWGHTCEVKYRRKTKWDYALNSNRINDFKSNIGILVWPGNTPKQLDICRMISQARFRKISLVHNFGYGDRLVVKWNNMSTFEQYIEFCKELPTI